MKKRYQNENNGKNSGVYSHRSERSSSSNVLSELNCNKYLSLLLKRPVRCRLNSQETITNEVETPQLDSRIYKQKKIEQLKTQLQILKQNFDKQSKSSLNLQGIIDGTIQELQELKMTLNAKHIEQPWTEIIKMERDIQQNEVNVINSMPINHFNEIVLSHQLGILELTATQQQAQQYNFWVTQLSVLHETFIKKNQIISKMFKSVDSLQQSIVIANDDELAQSFGIQY